VEDFSLLRDFALIMAVAGGVTFLLRKLHPPIVLCYLLAGVIISPYVLPLFSTSDVHTIGLLADIGLILLLFGVGLEFGWSKIRQVGLTALIIGGIEITTMICLGYGLGRLLGWSKVDSIFLGAALHTSSSAIIVKLLRDSGKLSLVSSRVIVGILVVEDFAAVVIIAVLSGVSTTTGIADFNYISSLALRLVIFVVSFLALGAFFIPRIVSFTHRFHSRETLLITCLGLCFAMALVSKELGLSVATGAFLVGALVGDTKESEDVVEVMSPVRDMFAAVFFVAIGMLVNVTQFHSFLLPALIVAAVFIIGKIVANTISAIISGYDTRTSLKVGLGMPQMGEFSLAIGRVGIEKGVTVAPVYPIIAVATTLTSLAGPYLTRYADPLIDWLGQKSPRILNEYLTHLNEWGKTIRKLFSEGGDEAKKLRKTGRTILINCLILLVIIGGGTFAMQFFENLTSHLTLRRDIVALLMGVTILVLCLPSMILIWRNLMTLINSATRHIVSDSSAGKSRRVEIVRTALRNSLTIIVSITIILWFIPLISQLLFIGYLPLAIPALLLAFVIYLVLRSIRGMHNQVEQAFSRVFLGDSGEPRNEYIAPPRQTLVRKLSRKVRMRVLGFSSKLKQRLPVKPRK
jgi:monovalent cation:H+ antiporter-2, CPA2 family